MNTPTPRNNAFTAAMNGKDDTEHLIELDKFSRQLEMELTDAIRERDEARGQRDRLAADLRIIAEGTSCRECGGEDQALRASEALQSLTTNEKP